MSLTIAEIKRHHDPLTEPLQADLKFRVQEDRFYEDRPDAGAVRAKNIGKQLIPHEQRVFSGAAAAFHRFQVCSAGWFSCVENILTLHFICKAFDSRFMIVGDDAGGEPNGSQIFKKSYRFRCRRCSMFHQCIVDIQDQSPVSFLI